MSHLPSASLGHYAPLSFVVIGRRQRTEDSLKFSCGSGFQAAILRRA